LAPQVFSHFYTQPSCQHSAITDKRLAQW
jgi:hypothetical protein